MKLGYFELISELEEVLEKKLHILYGPEYSLFLNPDTTQLEVADKREFIYEAIEIYHHSEKYTIKEENEKFWEIIKSLESEKRIAEKFEEMEKTLKKESPQLFEVEFKNAKNYKKTFEYIFTTIFIVVFVYLIFF